MIQTTAKKSSANTHNYGQIYRENPLNQRTAFILYIYIKYTRFILGSYGTDFHIRESTEGLYVTKIIMGVIGKLWG